MFSRKKTETKFAPAMYRQGDVLLERIAEAGTPVGKTLVAVPRDKGRVVLAYGEVTGHAHAIGQPRVYHYRASEGGGGDTVLKVEEPATLQHEEHATIALPPGLYRVTRQREWSDEDEIRYVAD